MNITCFINWLIYSYSILITIHLWIYKKKDFVYIINAKILFQIYICNLKKQSAIL